MTRNPIKATMHLPSDCADLNDFDWEPLLQPLTAEQKSKAEQAWRDQQFGNLTVGEACWMLQQAGLTGLPEPGKASGNALSATQRD